MAPKLDPAILKALSLEESCTALSAHGGSGFASTGKITSTVDGKEMRFFVKTGEGSESEIMFAGEHASLNAIHTAVPTLCPKSYAHGPLSSSQNSFFLATGFLDLSSSFSSTCTLTSSSKSHPTLSLAQKLVKLHSTPVPIPQGHSNPQFGFPVPTCCGPTIQDNNFTPSWSDFYANHRLLSILSSIRAKRGRDDAELSRLVNLTASKVVPRLLGDENLRDGRTGERIKPALVHGDLWSGNHGSAEMGGSAEAVVFDPSCVYAHSEFEFGIGWAMGGIGRREERKYWDLRGWDSPQEEWEDRMEIYALYHQLNHFCIFGGSYRRAAVKIMDKLIQKYGN